MTLKRCARKEKFVCNSHMAFITNPCDAMHSTGDACPQILKFHTPHCSLRKLESFGWNPSVVPAPPHLKRLLKKVGNVSFVATSRLDAGGETRFRCNNSEVHAASQLKLQTNVLFLDDHFRVLSKSIFAPVLCAASNTLMHPQDARLVNLFGAVIQVTYQSWTRGCYGQIASTVHFEKHRGNIRVVLQNHTKLSAKRNAGLLRLGNHVVQLEHTAPNMVWSHIDRKRVATKSTPFPKSLHNSIHPIHMTTNDTILGIAHRHYFNSHSPRPDMDGQFPPMLFRFGFSYRT